MSFDSSTLKRPITEETRAWVREDIPEISEISDKELQNKVVEAWAYALCQSGFNRISDIPGAGNPGFLELTDGDQADHIRAVARIALFIADDFKKRFPEADINRDYVVAGAIIHDIGKPYEFDPENLKRWADDPSRSGQPALRHSVYGAHVCLTVGLPEELAHIALGHSREGQHLNLSTECVIVRLTDHSWWDMATVLGLLKPESLAFPQIKLQPRKTLQ